MSLVGTSCALVYAGGNNCRIAVIRAATSILTRSSELSKVKVLLEYLDSNGEREWTFLTNNDKFSAVYAEDQLVWARRVLPAENNRPVAWPAKAYSLLCGSVGLSPDTILVEYFCDKEKAYLQLSETKQLDLLEAKATLSQHTQMLQELQSWEHQQKTTEVLTMFPVNLTGQRVNVCNARQQRSWIPGSVSSHNLQTRELTVVEEGRAAMHVVNPMLVQVTLPSLPPSLQQQQQQQQPTQTQSSTLSQQQSQLTGSGSWYHSTSSMASPAHSPGHQTLQHISSPYLSPSHQPQSRRCSLQPMNPALMHSEPNIHQRATTFDPVIGQYSRNQTLTPSGSCTNITSHVNSPPSSYFPHDDFGVPLDPEPLLRSSERSKSLGNIHLLVQQQSHNVSYKRRASHNVPLMGAPKKTRFDPLPVIRQEDDNHLSLPLNKSLSRSVSQPVLFPLRNSRQQAMQNPQEDDDLDLIHSIISRDSLDNSPELASQMRSQSLSHIPRELQGSMPVLHHASSMHVLHETYASNPDFSAALGSPPPYRQLSLPQPTSQHMEMVTAATADSTIQALSDTDALLPGQAALQFDLPLLGQRDSRRDNTGMPTTVSFSDLPEEGLLHLDLPSPLVDVTEKPYTDLGKVSAQPDTPQKPLHVASSPQVLSPASDPGDHPAVIEEESEVPINCIVNQHMAEGDNLPVPTSNSSSSPSSSTTHQNLTASARNTIPASDKTRVGNREVQTVLPTSLLNKRGRGRPRLTEDEKQRRKELRDMGLMKRSKRRTKEEVLRWKAERIKSPAKRGRKPGTGKKNMVRGVTGKVILVTVNLQKYHNGAVFFQNGFCQAYPGLSKCLECNTSGTSDFPASRYCRFLEFRKLCVVDNQEGVVHVEGFAMYNDSQSEDMVPWMPLKTGYSGMDIDTALYVLTRIIKCFMEVISEEAYTLTFSDNDVLPMWKRAVKGVRELCDTCETTIFNLHWVCQYCGFCICPACYKQAHSSHSGSEAVSSWQTPWPLCSINDQPHSTFSLVLTQIIPGNVLGDMLCQTLQICQAHRISMTPPSTLTHLLAMLSRQQLPSTNLGHNKKKRLSGDLKDIPPVVKTIAEPSLELPHSCSNGCGEDLLSTHHQLEAPHYLLCDGDLLCLLDPVHPANVTAFQAVWRNNKPVVVASVDQRLNKELWTPISFLRDFGEEPADLVDCRSGRVIPQVPTKAFWSGFENIDARLKDPEYNETRLLKLKDWPTREDFCDKLPLRFSDLMKSLPLPDYTRREGRLNMAATLPDFFVKPDLGPKMYNAYGTVAHPQHGTTNLHLDISDAVNLMVYAASSKANHEEEELLMESVKRECCEQSFRRVQAGKKNVGALWHIYSPADTDKIRRFLLKVYEEGGMNTSRPGTDPIHDQLIYLDDVLRKRLWQEERVKGWAIVQCIGDAIFIPAGAPHQVQNLTSCIKVAEDFVSPEHVKECLNLTEEFRQLSDRHANHEDKLQIKNILYHTVKDIVGVLRPSK